MRYGLLSDIHGNLEALTVILDYLQYQAIDEYLFLGDAVGYGANPNEVCDLIRPLISYGVTGNHDAAVSGRMDYDDYYDAAKYSIDWTINQLSTDNFQWLQQLPYTVSQDSLLISHGSPLVPEIFDYLFTTEQLASLHDRYDMLAHITFIGHSHLTFCFSLTAEENQQLPGTSIILKSDRKYIITVGSVGQPRDRDSRACCGIYDSEKKQFTFHRLEYDNQLARKKIINAGLAPIFGERLLVGM